MPDKSQPGPRAVLLSADSAGFEPIGAPIERDGQIVRRFKKELIHVGLYRHPVMDWTLDVTTERMDAWIAASKTMAENGVKVPIVADHAIGDSERTLGYVEGALWREGDVLYGVHEIVGDAQIALALRINQTSVWIDQDFHDGEGRSYGEVILHNSITPEPVVNDQEGFVAIAASRSGRTTVEKAPVYVLSTDRGAKDMTDEQIKQLREIMGAGDDLTADNALSRIAERFKGHGADLEARDKELADLKAKVETLTAEVKAASRDAKPEVDAEVLDDRGESAEERIDGLVSKGSILPAVAASLKPVLCGEAGKRNGYMLSRKLSGTPQSIARMVIDALAQNDPVKLGEQTRSQAVALSRDVPGEADANPDPEDIKQRGAFTLSVASPASRG